MSRIAVASDDGFKSIIVQICSSEVDDCEFEIFLLSTFRRSVFTGSHVPVGEHFTRTTEYTPLLTRASHLKAALPLNPTSASKPGSVLLRRV